MEKYSINNPLLLPLRPTEYNTSHCVKYTGLKIPDILANTPFDHLTTEGEWQPFHFHHAEFLSCLTTILLTFFFSWMVWLCFAFFQKLNTPSSDNTTLNLSSAINYIYITSKTKSSGTLELLKNTSWEPLVYTCSVLGVLPCLCLLQHNKWALTRVEWARNSSWLSPWGLKEHSALSGRESPPQPLHWNKHLRLFVRLQRNEKWI